MMLRSRSLHRLLQRTLTALVGFLTAVANAQGQTSWTVDPKASLAWWQMSPNFSQLWATTCPLEPSWRPGEGASPEWANPAPRRATGYANVPDTVHVPLYPRDEVRSVCGEAVEGRVVLADTVGRRGARAQVTVRAEVARSGAVASGGVPNVGDGPQPRGGD